MLLNSVPPHVGYVTRYLGGGFFRAGVASGLIRIGATSWPPDVLVKHARP
jgi:hypothetical protein